MQAVEQRQRPVEYVGADLEPPLVPDLQPNVPTHGCKTYRARQLLFQVQITPPFTRSVCHLDCTCFRLDLVQPADDALDVGPHLYLFRRPAASNLADHADDFPVSPQIVLGLISSI